LTVEYGKLAAKSGEFLKSTIRSNTSGNELLTIMEKQFGVSSDMVSLSDQLGASIQEVVKQGGKHLNLANSVKQSFTEIGASLTVISKLSNDINPIIDGRSVQDSHDGLQEVSSDVGNILSQLDQSMRDRSMTIEIDGNVVPVHDVMNDLQDTLSLNLMVDVTELEAVSEAVAQGIGGGIAIDPTIMKAFSEELTKINGSIPENIKLADPANLDAYIKAIETGKSVSQIKSGFGGKDAKLGYEESSAAASGYMDLVDKIISQKANLVDEAGNFISMTEQETAAATALMSALEKTGNASLISWIDQEAAIRENNELIKYQLKNAQSSLTTFKKFAPALTTVSEIGNDIQQSFQSLSSVLPGNLGAILGMEKAAEAFGTSFQMAAGGLVSDLQAGVGLSRALVTNFGAIPSKILGMLGPFAAIAAIVGGLIAGVMSIGNSTREMSAQLGVSRARAKELYKSSLDITNSWDNQLTTHEDVVSVLEAQKELYGFVLDISSEAAQESIKFSAALGKQYGMAAGEVYKLSSQFETLGADQGLAENLTAAAAHAADLNGIPFKNIAEDLANNSEFIATHFSGMPKKALQAALGVRKMGVSLENASKIMDSAMDISSFSTNMSELFAMTGGAADLSEVFNLRAAGADVEDVTKAALDQFDKMKASGRANEFTMKKFADSVGMSVADLEKSHTIRTKLSKLSTEEGDILQKNLHLLSDAELSDMKSAKLAAAKLDTQEKFGVAMSKLKGELIRGLLPLIEAFGEGLEIVLPIISLIGKGIGWMAKAVSFVLTPLRWVFKLLGGIGDALTGNFAGFGAVFSDIGNEITEAFTGGIKAIVKRGLPILVGFGLLAKIGMLKHLSKIPFNLVGVLKKSGGAIAKVGNLLGSKIGLSMDSGMGKSLKGMGSKIMDSGMGKSLKGMGSKIGLSKASGMGKSLKGMGSNKLVESVTNAGGKMSGAKSGIGSKMTDSLKGVTDKTSSLGKSLVDAFKNIGKGIKNILTGIVDTVGKMLQSLGKGIGKFFQAILTGIGKGLNAFSANALIGAAALTLVAASLWITSKAMQNFQDIEWETFAKAGAALIGLGIAAVAFGAFLAPILLGAVAIGALGLALIPLAAAVAIASPGLAAMFASLESVDVGALLAIGPALAGIAIGMAALGAASAGNALVGLFADDPVDKLKELAAVADPISVLADALVKLNESLKILPESMSAIGDIDVDKLSSIPTVSMNATTKLEPSNAGSLPEAASSVAASDPVNVAAVASTTKSPGMGDHKIMQLVNQLTQAYVAGQDRPITIYLGDSEIRRFNKNIKKFNNTN